MDDASILNELRSLVLSKTCIQSITPADCKRISLEISQTLHRTLSETTIKRIFGFANSQHNFSKFTLAALAEYVDKHPGHTVYDGWQDIDLKASSITTNTINNIKNRAEIPFQMTISRDFSISYFEEFYHSDCSFTCLTSPPGYGRSILLNHLAENLQRNQIPDQYNTTLLFITARSLFEKNAEEVNFEEQLKSLLGIHPNESLIQYADLNYEQTGKGLTIFVDGFCELELKNSFRQQLLESIFQFIHDLADSKSIKLLLSMRSNTWRKYDMLIRKSGFLKNKWFQGRNYDYKAFSNVPKLSSNEVTKILRQIDDRKIADEELLHHLRIPLHLSLYYQILEEKSYLNIRPEITTRDLTAQYVRDKIYRSNYYTEKIQFLRKIIHLTDFGKNGMCTSKELLITDLSAFKNAYMELLSDGILLENNCQPDFSENQTVCFSHVNVFDYFLQIELRLSANNNTD